MRKLTLTVLMTLLFSCCVGSMAMAEITSAVSADDLALAMDIVQGDINIASTLGTSHGAGVGVATGSLGKFMPRKGNSFVILSTGNADIADDANDEGNSGSILSGLNNSAGEDMVQLTLVLNVPTDATCASFDFIFHSEEFDEYVGSEFNDAFTAELGTSDQSIVANQVVAPKNFAFDSLGDIISVNTVYGVSGDTETTYDGATPKIRATTPIDPNASTITLVFTIQDLGDSIYDSAVFIDNFQWGINAVCSAGTFIDSDDDGIQDRHEILGVDIDDDGDIDLDLPAMGADPFHKDIFVEIDYMENGLHSHQPKLAALQKLIDAFANAPVDNPDDTQGINIHIDAGPHSIMDPTLNQTWTNYHSKSNAIDHTDEIGSAIADEYNWSEFDAIKDANFAAERRGFFRYGLFAHRLGGLGSANGLERGIPSTDFIVSLSAWTDGIGTACEQAGSLMHILGHTLGLRHGGEDNVNYKPNYLSVMNHAFLTRGLRVNGLDGVFDYSRFDLADLDENNLDESIGLNGGAASNTYGTIYHDGSELHYANAVNDRIDWNGNLIFTDTVPVDINQDSSLTTLTSQNDWENLNYTAGVLGQLTIVVDPPATTTAAVLTVTEDDQLDSFYDVKANVWCTGEVTANLPATCGVDIQNIGTLADTYSLSGLSAYNWGNFDALPATVELEPGETASFDITVTPQSWASVGYVDKLSVDVESVNNPNLLDGGEYNVAVTQNGESSPPSLSIGSSSGSGGCFITSLVK